MLNRIVKGILIASLLTFPQTNTVNGFAIEYDKDLKETDIKAINDLKIHEDKPFGLHKGYNNLQAKIEEHKKIQEAVQRRLEEIKRREEEQKRLEEEQRRLEEEKKNSFDLTLEFSFYTDLAEENGGYSGITCTGKRLKYGFIASNVWALGTKFQTEQGEIFTVSDTGGGDFNSYNRVDCFIPRNSGESDYQYKKRVLNMGRKIIKVKKIN